MGIPRTHFARSLKSFYDWLETGAGSVPSVTGLSVDEQGLAHRKKTILNLASVPLVLSDQAGVIAYKGIKLYDFPEGLIKVDGVVVNLSVAKSSAGVIATWSGKVSVGTVTAGNDATLTSTEANLVASTNVGPAVAGVQSVKALPTAAAWLDGTTTAIDLYLNILVNDTDHDVTTTPCNLLLTGTVTVHWMNLGDV